MNIDIQDTSGNENIDLNKSIKDLTIEQCEEKISELDREISKFSDEIHFLESELELQRSSVDVLQAKKQENGSLQSFVLVFFLICFSIWMAFH